MLIALLHCAACRLSVLVAVAVFVVVTVMLSLRPPGRDLAGRKETGQYGSSGRAADPPKMFWDPTGSAVANDDLDSLILLPWCVLQQSRRPSGLVFNAADWAAAVALVSHIGRIA